MRLRHLHAVLGFVAVLSAAGAGCAPGPIDKPIKLDPVAKGPGTLTEARQYLQGQWTLVSMDLFPPEKPAIRGAATGTMVYDDFSNMKVDLQFTPAAAQLAESIGIPLKDGILSTDGRTVIDIENKAISYVFEGQSGVRAPTSPLDTNLPRYWEVSGNTLTLRTRDTAGKMLSITVWKKN
jgi:hypothetical protein